MKQRQFSADGVNENARFILQTNLEDMNNITYTLWVRQGGVFVEMEAFKTFSAASQKTRTIIESVMEFRHIIHA